MSRRAADYISSQESVENLKFIAEKCVSYLVNKDGCKVPVKRAALVKFISSFNMEDVNVKKLNIVLALTNSLLQETYGYKLVEIESKSGPQYITILDSGDGPPHNVNNNHDSNNALLVVSLIHIFMSGGTLKEDALFRFLEKSGLMTQNDHCKRTLCNTFTKQAYLTYTKVGEADNVRYVFEWGQRAHEEFPKLKMLEKLGEAFDRSPDYWFEQHKQANQPTEIDE